MIHFGTGGFRGVIADDFSRANVEKIAQGIANLYIKKESHKPIVVGYDFRYASKEASEWIASVLSANGIHVLLANTPSPTPTIMFHSKRLDNDFGVMITASHNPYWFNGVKLFQGEGMDAEKSLTDRLEKIIAEVTDIKTMPLETGIEQDLIQKIDVLEEYIDGVSDFVSIKNTDSELKVLLDPIYGTGALTLKPTLEKMGLKNIKVIENERDPFFHGHLPNPIPSNLELARKVLLEEGYDLAIATDSDCDRIAVLDEKGEYIDANNILGAIYYFLVKYRNQKGDVVKNLATSDLIDALADKLGFECHEVDVGFKNISQAMKDYECLIGGESSGGLTVRNYLFGKDSTFATALFVEMVLTIGKPVSMIIKEVRDFASFDKVTDEDSISFKSAEKVKEACRKNSPAFDDKVRNLSEIGNNFKYRFENGDWALLRFSGTEPVLRIFYETKDRAFAEKEIKAIKDFVTQSEK